jgi:hypothetical protein
LPHLAAIKKCGTRVLIESNLYALVSDGVSMEPESEKPLSICFDTLHDVVDVQDVEVMQLAYHFDMF